MSNNILNGILLAQDTQRVRQTGTDRHRERERERDRNKEVDKR